ncbi:MAG: sirohydrochlorin chelatase [Oscillochloris sp.]|nr:sirohydrochlorin chelatase [Oscillochloris sp.]
MMIQNSHTILLIGHGSPDPAGNAEFLDFARQLEHKLAVPTQPCFLELAEPSIGAGFARCVAQGAQEIAVLPLFLGPGRHQKRDVPGLLAAAQEQHPQVSLRYGKAVGPHDALIAALSERAQAALARSSVAATDAETALLVVGRGSKDTQSNAELARLARMLYERQSYGMVEYAFQLVVAPNVGQAIERCVQLGARRVVVLPYLLFTGVVRDDIVAQADAAQALHPQVEVLVGEHLFPHPGLLTAVAERYHELCAGGSMLMYDLGDYRQYAGDDDDDDDHHHHHHHGQHHHHHDQLDDDHDHGDEQP